MKNGTKLKRVKEFLAENNIKYVVPKKSGLPGHSNVVLPDLKISIKLSDGDDQKYYEKRHALFHIIFIRDKETTKFVLEKVQNTIIKTMKKMQEKLMQSK